jgi:putative transposase
MPRAGPTSRYVAIRYTERLVEAEAVSSVRSNGDSYDNALGRVGQRAVQGRAAQPPWTWRSVAEVELATAKWVHLWNTGRLHSGYGDVPQAEFEAAYHQALEATAAAA